MIPIALLMLAGAGWHSLFDGVSTEGLVGGNGQAVSGRVVGGGGWLSEGGADAWERCRISGRLRVMNRSSWNSSGKS